MRRFGQQPNPETARSWARPDVAFGHTDPVGPGKPACSLNGRTRRPLIRSHAASVVRASAIPGRRPPHRDPLPARFNTGPCESSAFCNAGNLEPTLPTPCDRQDGAREISGTSAGLDRRRCRPERSLGLQTANNCSGLSRITSFPGQLPSPCRTARSTPLGRSRRDAGSLNPQIDFGMRLGKTPKPMHQPFGCEVR